MKIRIFKRLIDGVFDVRINTEDWSENDRNLMIKFGEPEINLGGTFSCSEQSSSGDSSSSGSSGEPGISVRFDDVYARIMTESPFTQRFDARDLGSTTRAKEAADCWCATIESRLMTAVSNLRAKDDFFSTEEILEV